MTDVDTTGIARLCAKAAEQFSSHFKTRHTVAAYAPGRIEVLGNHTDYNDGYVLSAGIDMGTCFLAAPSVSTACRIVSGNSMKEAAFEVASHAPVSGETWANYIRGVFGKLAEHGQIKGGFFGLILGDLPLGSGLSSSAALEMSVGLGLSSLYGIEVDKLTLAKIGQAAEHQYVGIRCGLLDQISAMFAKENQLVMSDFRTLKVEHVPFADDARFIICNTNVKHSLVDSEYNERRATCEKAAKYFATVLPHPVTALRDVTMTEWRQHSAAMDPLQKKRAAHVIGENTRVLTGRQFLDAGKLNEFGGLMYESHESSRANYENSCDELDFVVDTARKMPGALGARLSGGGFGGSAVVLSLSADANAIGKAIAAAYDARFAHACEIRIVRPSDGARIC